MTEKMKFETKDLTQENIAKIGQLFPEVLTEAKDDNGTLKKAIDFDKLRQILSDSAIDNRETYDFTWVGKKQAILEAATPIRKTLRPCKKESVNWDTTQNLYIEGDNLDVLKLLQESYLGKVKMIYIDPPYNTGNDALPYNDNFKETIEEYEDKINTRNEDGCKMFTNKDTNGRFHSNWLNMMYPRLKLARNLLTEDGIIFISIDDREVENLRKLCEDEIFGANNFVSQLVVEGTPKNDPYIVSTAHEYCLVFVKNFEIAKEANYGITNPLYEDLLNIYRTNGTDYKKTMKDLKDYFNKKDLMSDNISNYKFADKQGIYRIGPIDDPQGQGSKDIRMNPKTGKACAIPASGWRCTLATWKEWMKQDLILFPEEDSILPAKKTYITEDRIDVMRAFFKFQTRKDTDMLKKMFELDNTPFSNPKPLELIQTFIENMNDKNAIVMDFFSGSATTAHAAMKLNSKDAGNRQFIMVQWPDKIELKKGISNREKKVIQAALSFLRKHNLKENICEIGKERIRRAAKQIKEEHPKSNFDGGFRVFKLADSNMKDVYYNPAEYTQDLLDKMTSNIKEDRNDMDLLYGCMLEWGLPLSYPHTSEKVGSYTIHTVNNGDLMACFDENVTEDIIRHIAAKKPLRVVFRDAGFADSPAKINVGELFKLISPDTKVKVI